MFKAPESYYFYSKVFNKHLDEAAFFLAIWAKDFMNKSASEEVTQSSYQGKRAMLHTRLGYSKAVTAAGCDECYGYATEGLDKGWVLHSFTLAAQAQLTVLIAPPGEQLTICQSPQQ